MRGAPQVHQVHEKSSPVRSFAPTVFDANLPIRPKTELSLLAKLANGMVYLPDHCSQAIVPSVRRGQKSHERTKSKIGSCVLGSSSIYLPQSKPVH